MPTEPVDVSKFEYRDMFGRDIKVGDYIVYAALADRSGVLRAGRVIELTYSKAGYGDVVPKVKVESWNNFDAQRWDGQRSGRQRNVSLGFLDRLVVVDPTTVSDKVKKDLDGPIETRW